MLGRPGDRPIHFTSGASHNVEGECSQSRGTAPATTHHHAPALVGTLALTVGVLAGTMLAPAASASSHREAPSISKDPSADNTDVYAFVSPDRTDTVTLVANYIPAEQPSGGPNFYEWDPSVLYEIHVHNGNGSNDEITYQFRFKTRVLNPDTFLYRDKFD